MTSARPHPPTAQATNTRHAPLSRPRQRSAVAAWVTNGLSAVLLATVANAHANNNAPSNSWAELTDGRVVLFRHASAPGGGDPAGFRVSDCNTQRNLDSAGREQARRLGLSFVQRQVPVGRVLNSQWCRTRDTAQLAFGATATTDEPLFNSFFGAPGDGEPQTRQALDLLLRWRGPGVLVVVTHQVNITALTGIWPAQGEGVVVQPQGPSLKVLGRLVP